MVFFTEAQQNFRRKVQEFAAKELAPGTIERANFDHIPREIIKKLAKEKFFKSACPVKYGGDPIDSVSMGILFEEISKVDCSVLTPVGNAIFISLMMDSASEELKEEWLPLVVTGEKIPCFANTEPDCGSDAGAIRTTAISDGDSYIFHGEKTSVSMGMQADFLVLTAKTDPDAGARGISLFLIPLDLSGIDRSPFHDMGVHPTGRASIALSEVRVPAKCRIIEQGAAFAKVMQGFDFFRALGGLTAVGLAEATLAEAVQHVQERTAFSNPLSKFQGVSFKLAEHATVIEAARLLCYKVLMLRDKGHPTAKESAMAKWYAPLYASRAIHDLLLLFGWRGYSETYRIEQRLRDVIGFQIGDGTAEIMKMVIAREMLGKGFAPTM